MKDNGFKRFQGTPGYIASGPLVDAVNCAIALARPIKSTSKAAEGFYVYRTVQRLNDSRFGPGNVADIGRYIKLGPLGEVFAASARHVLLIDEIDKAALEF